jgi:hypothetical protein
VKGGLLSVVRAACTGPQVTPSAAFSPAEAVEVQLKALQHNDDPWINHGVRMACARASALPLCLRVSTACGAPAAESAILRHFRLPSCPYTPAQLVASQVASQVGRAAVHGRS